MSRRKGQNGSRIEKHGGYYTSRLWMDVPEQEERVHIRVKISPVDRSAPGWLNKAERENKLKSIIAKMGANSEERFNEVVTRTKNSLVTFAEQGEVYLEQLATRGEHGASPHTLEGFRLCLSNWLNPMIGTLPLEKVNSLELKRVVARMKQNGLMPRIEQEEREKGTPDGKITQMRKKGLSASSIHRYVLVAKLVVASAVDEQGEFLYPRRWNNKFIELPKISKKNMNTPSFSSEIMTGLANYRIPRERGIFTLSGCAGTRISEILAVEIDKHISKDFRTLKIEQQVVRGKVVPWLKTDAAYRQIDLDSDGAEALKKIVGDRTSGFLFRTRTGKPVDTNNIYFHLHRALKELGFVNPFTGDHRAGNHAFRRFRNTWLRNNTQCSEGLRKFWLGHAGEDMGDLYDKIQENLPFRLEMAEKCGHGFQIPEVVPSVPTFQQQQTAEDKAQLYDFTIA